jgi:hypothetical protein
VVAEGVRGVIVGPDFLWGGAAGAVLVALFTIGYTEVREARQRVRARMGYARFLGAEIQANGETLEPFNDEDWASEVGQGNALDRISVDAWREARVPLASLIKAEDFDSLVEYYRRLEELMELKGEKVLGAGVAYRRTSAVMDKTPIVRGLLSRYANPPARVRRLGF